MPTTREVASYLRIASLSIALYDVLATLRAEYCLYRYQFEKRRLSLSCACFFLVRYLSIITLVASTIGFFGTGFSVESCSKYFRVAPAFKLLALVVSQVIIAMRTYAIARNRRWIKWFLASLFISSLVPEVVGSVMFRIPVQNASGNCTAGNPAHDKISWIFYLSAMIFDFVATAIASIYLFIASPGSVSLMNNFTRMLFENGLLYFISMTAVNALNVVTFNLNDPVAQPSAANLGTAVTMIMSQRLILDLHEKRLDDRYTKTISQNSKGIVIQTGAGVSFGPFPPEQDIELGTMRVHVDIEIERDSLSTPKKVDQTLPASSADESLKRAWSA